MDCKLQNYTGNQSFKTKFSYSLTLLISKYYRQTDTNSCSFATQNCIEKIYANDTIQNFIHLLSTYLSYLQFQRAKMFYNLCLNQQNIFTY